VGGVLFIDAPARHARRSLPALLFMSPWAAFAIPLLVPLVVLLA
jgi:hypothetical protein